MAGISIKTTLVEQCMQCNSIISEHPHEHYWKPVGSDVAMLFPYMK